MGMEYPKLDSLVGHVAHPEATIEFANFVRVGRDGDEAERLATSQRLVDDYAARFRESGYDSKSYSQIITKSAGMALGDRALAIGAELLVVGMVSRSRVGKALVGSDAQAALLSAPCPILAYRSFA